MYIPRAIHIASAISSGGRRIREASVSRTYPALSHTRRKRSIDLTSAVATTARAQPDRTPHKAMHQTFPSFQETPPTTSRAQETTDHQLTHAINTAPTRSNRGSGYLVGTSRLILLESHGDETLGALVGSDRVDGRHFLSETAGGVPKVRWACVSVRARVYLYVVVRVRVRTSYVCLCVHACTWRKGGPLHDDRFT